MTENNLVKAALKRLYKQKSFKVCCEVPILGRSADMVYIIGKLLTTIEFKLKNWKKALRQSGDHKLGADYSYVCMPRRCVSEEMRQEFIDRGVGLVFFKEKGKWPFEEIIKASRSIEAWPAIRSRVAEYIKERYREN